ncbi:MAG: ABC transporter permease [Bacteroidetes bacterium]|nr:ABC transporter permease [Bacteroidota bacterium]
MKIPLSYNWRNLLARRLTTGLTVTGISLVVFVFAAVLMLAQGIEDTLVATGSEDNVILIREGSQSELMSSLTREQIDLVSTFPELARDNDNQPLLTADVVTMINLHKKQSGDMGNIAVRGISPGAFDLRPQVRLESGRWFKPGQLEVVIGNKIAEQFENTAVGDQIEIGSKKWEVVGILEAGKTGFASEIWGDADLVLSEFNRQNVFSSATFRLSDPAEFEIIKTKLETERRLQELDVKREQTYYKEQSQFMATFISALGLVITVIFSFGAMIGAMITMYAAVANRTVEIGTLRALGFRRRSILTAFLIESLVLSLIGAGIGLGLASFLQMVSFSTTNFGSFSELAFGFSLNPVIVLSTVVFSLVMGIFGGFLPAVRAARMDIVNSLRAGG